ncbi:uncharacterized protein [Malus domestica]|uniref:uncharacterized protein n=1 Tax=Malus domestica TaxID=3750 RepID=UPI00397497D6
MRWKSWKAMPDEVKTKVRDCLLVALEEGCPKEFKDREENWVWLCSDFQEPNYVKAKANKINPEKKTLLHHSGSRPFSYRMETWRQRGSKFPDADVFADVYV